MFKQRLKPIQKGQLLTWEVRVRHILKYLCTPKFFKCIDHIISVLLILSSYTILMTIMYFCLWILYLRQGPYHELSVRNPSHFFAKCWAFTFFMLTKVIIFPLDQTEWNV